MENAIWVRVDEIPKTEKLAQYCIIYSILLISRHIDTTLAPFADDTAVLSVSPHANYNVATSRLQVAVIEMTNWATRRQIKINLRENSTSGPFNFEPTTTIQQITNDESVQLTESAQATQGLKRKTLANIN